MKPNLLFTPVFRIIGIILTLSGLVFGYIFLYRDQVISFLDYRSGNLTDEFGTTFEITGLLFIGFSRLKSENDLTQRLRLNALYWSVMVNCLWISVFYITLLLGEVIKMPVFLQHISSFDVTTYNLFILLFIFVTRFYHLQYKAKNGRESKPVYLLPHTPYNWAGKIFSALFIMLGIALVIPLFKIRPKYADAFILFLPALLMWIWSREKNQNDEINEIRFKAMQLAIYVNYGLFLIATWVFYGIEYWLVQCVGLISVQVIFLFIFYYQLYRLRKRHPLAATNL